LKDEVGSAELMEEISQTRKVEGVHEVDDAFEIASAQVPLRYLELPQYLRSVQLRLLFAFFRMVRLIAADLLFIFVVDPIYMCHFKIFYN
jgi:hypothetical protein